mmetsp:Transcript_942/g.1041  ORF Transcript_942/g.1041 Transcript_942/m.1041 type:complete len:1331 (+) Transcript_942:60-4052(+)
MGSVDRNISPKNNPGLTKVTPFEQEEECRVCRGPAEEGHPLFSPCKCSGSIGLTHQDCLTSWLKVQRGDGRCELCGTKFRFAPLYAEDAPEQLHWYQVILGIMRSAVGKWFPFVIRMIIAFALWLLFVPLATAYSYLGWLHSPSTISKRFEWDLLISDTISGAIIAGIIIVSFLSLMSFADFLRFNFRRGRQNQNENNGVDDGPLVDDEIDKIDEVVLEHEYTTERQFDLDLMDLIDQQQGVLTHSEGRRVRVIEGRGSPLDVQGLMQEIPDESTTDRQREIDLLEQENDEHENIDQNNPLPINLDLLPNDEVQIANFLRDIENEDENNPAEDDIPPRQNNFEPPFQPREQVGNQDEMEMNLALDELLGLRGPVGALVRNISWLMAFNITYLGLFAFLPRFVGATVFNRILNSTVTEIVSSMSFFQPLDTMNSTSSGILALIVDLNLETKRFRRTLQLNDLFFLVLGYMSMAIFVVLIQSIVSLRRRMRPSDETMIDHQENPQVAAGNLARDNQAANDGNNFGAFAMNDEAIEIRITLGQFLSLALECAGAFVKVGVLLFLKMLLLPLVLGIWLDAATLNAFGCETSQRILHAGNDLFSSLSVHWVVGITFMLLVTVSVLQLREVVHPALLARMIRPQEPQPDLLGNLLSESGTTHAKRMILSLGIYTFLLTIHIWLPSYFLVYCGLDVYVPFFRPNFWYILTPQLQVPLELLVFHLTMLGFLEKYKNNIGGMQHWWLMCVCKPVGLIDYLLPRSIKRFVLVGWKRIFLVNEIEADIGNAIDSVSRKTDFDTTVDLFSHVTTNQRINQSERKKCVRTLKKIDPFWYELMTCEGDIERFIDSGITFVSTSEDPCYEPVQQRMDKKCTINGAKDYICLPISFQVGNAASQNKKLRNSHVSTLRETKNLISSTLGKYRLRRNTGKDNEIIVEFWKECYGDIITRPPEGWDDLVAGGAEAQGRWAWGKEQKSSIEQGVAARCNFFDQYISKGKSTYLLMKVVSVLVLSWTAVTIVMIVGLSSPLVIGRTALSLLRIPSKYIHDPAAFAIGLMSLYHFIKSFSSFMKSWVTCIKKWVQSFCSPPNSKSFILAQSLVHWCIAIPLILGMLYEFMIIKPQEYFKTAPGLFLSVDILESWSSGFMILNVWALLCYNSMFTWQFWVNIGNAAFDADDRDAALDMNRPHLRLQTLWQGAENGRIAQFFRIYADVFCCWEWDQIDANILFYDCIYPIERNIVIALILPSLMLGLLGLETIDILITQFGFKMDDGVFQVFFFRIIASVTIFTMCIRGFSQEIVLWFNVLHKTARDDQYLIGEVLLNYAEDCDAELSVQANGS